jgi:hypothetical protein
MLEGPCNSQNEEGRPPNPLVGVAFALVLEKAIAHEPAGCTDAQSPIHRGRLNPHIDSTTKVALRRV